MDNIIDYIKDAMDDEDDNLDKQSDLLLDAYHSADAQGQALIDTVVLCLCGWKLTTLIDKMETRR